MSENVKQEGEFKLRKKPAMKKLDKPNVVSKVDLTIKKEETNAIQESNTNESMLGSQGSEVGLQEVVEGNAKHEQVATEEGEKEIIIMHCTSIYPAKDQFLNMNVLDELKKKFNLQLGYSDHSLNDLASLAAVSKNAKFVEKHVTLDRQLKGPDHLASYNIKEFKNFVENIRKLEIILGSREKIFSKEENQIKNMARKSIVSNVDIYKNNEISLKDITFKRPGTGISPLDYKKVLRNQLRINLEKDKVITKNMLKY